MRLRTIALLFGGVALLLAALSPTIAQQPAPDDEPPTQQSTQRPPEGFRDRRPDTTKPVDSINRSIAAGLNWLARHQSPDGNWNTENFRKVCKDDTCTGTGEVVTDSASTSAALLSFLAAGQTHKTKGPYKRNIYAGLYFLIKHQEMDGSLAEGMDASLSGHSLATIVLCECYGLSKDRTVADPAQRALNFLRDAPLPEGQTWQYRPGRTGDSTPVVWQMLALESGRRCGLEVDVSKIKGRAQWLLKTTLAAPADDLPAAAAGLLAAQVLGKPADADDTRAMVRRLLAAPEGDVPRDCVAQVFAATAVRARGGEDWETWRKALVKTLIEDQIKAGCAAGSWAPDKPTADAWGTVGGREYVTAMSTISLLPHVRYLQLFQPAPAH